MGTDKALLPLGGVRMVNRVANAVAAATGSVTLIGDPEKYRHLGYPVAPDAFPGCGPLAGIHAALGVTRADWNLVVACDMPEVQGDFLRRLVESAERSGVDGLLPVGRSGRPEPLCAVYHRRCLPAIEAVLRNGVRKVVDGLAGLRMETLPVDEAEFFRNLNTAEEWLDYTSAQKDKTRKSGI